MTIVALSGIIVVKLADKLQKLQNRAARILTFSSYDVNADVVLASIDWKKLETQRKIQKALMVHKSLYGLAPDYLRSMFVNRSIVANYSLRDTEGKLAIPKPRTDYLRNSFSYSGAVLWNSLPPDLRQTENLNQFKAGCVNFLPMNCMFYTALLESRSIIVNYLTISSIKVLVLKCKYFLKLYIYLVVACKS